MLLSTMNKLSTPHTTVKVFEIGILNPVLGFCQGLPLPRDHQFIKKAPVYRSINEDFGLLYSHSKVFSLHSLPSLQAASKMLTLCYPSSASHFPTHPSQHHHSWILIVAPVLWRQWTQPSTQEMQKVPCSSKCERPWLELPPHPLTWKCPETVVWTTW